MGLFTVINQQFQVPLKSALLPHDGNMTNALVTLLNFSWFLAYPFSEGFATRWVDRLGYRKTSVYSLLIFIVGLGFYEAAVLLHIYAPSYITIMGNPIFTGFFVFLSGSFVIGMAVTILQVVTGLYLDVNPVGKTTPLQRQMIAERPIPSVWLSARWWSVTSYFTVFLSTMYNPVNLSGP